MHVIPCELCGYDAPGDVCPHCRGTSAERSLAREARSTSTVRAGLAALVRGLGFLATTRGTKRWLVPPFVLTTLAFGALFAWAYERFDALVEHARQAAGGGAAPAGFWQRVLEFLVESSVFLVLAKLTGLLLILVIGFFAALYTFSLFYAAISGPFLDEVQGRIEARWFGVDPRNALERPTTLSVARCGAWTALATLVAVIALVFAWRIDSPARVWALCAAALVPFVALGLWKREWGRWFVWALRTEASTLWTSVRTSLFALLLLVFCLPLKLVPLAGPFLFAGAAGFATSISLLDIPFSRRRWSLGQRLAFLAQHAAPLVVFGSMASLLFLIPFAGPVLMVPAASIGGLWLVVRLDKSRLRAQSARRAARLAGRADVQAGAAPPARDRR